MEKADYISIFKYVLKDLVNREYKEEIQTEFPKKSDFDKNYEDNFSIFEYFPRNSSTYCEIISTLTKIAKCGNGCQRITEIINYLSKESDSIILKNKDLTRDFGIFLETRSTGVLQPLFFKEHFLLLLLFTDLILSIIKTYGVPLNIEHLIMVGLNLVFKYKEICINILLEQWSIIFSIISREHPTEIFNKIKTNFEAIKKGKRLRFFFTLIRYFRLDSPGFDSTEFIQFLSQVIAELDLFPREKSSVFTSLSTLFITYTGDPKNLERFYDAAIKCWKDPNLNCPGALDLATVLMVKMKKFDIETIKTFCVENVFSIANEQGMMPTAARVFRNYIWNFSLDPDLVFTGWGLESNDNFYIQLKNLNKDDNNLFILFEKYFLPSLSFNECQSLLSDIIVLLSSIDFKYIRRWFKSVYENYGFSDIRIMSMIKALPNINNPQLSNNNEQTKKDIERFIEEFASRFFLEMYPKLNSDYCINNDIRKKYEGCIDKATKSIENYNTNNHFDFGSSYEEVSIFFRNSLQKDLPYSELMEYMPSIVKGGLSDMKGLTEGFIVLSASRINKISRPMFQSCALLLKNPKSTFELIKRMIEIVKSPRHDAMICNCLKLLKKALDEPLEDIYPTPELDENGNPKNNNQKVYTKEKLLHSIEFSAFMGLLSDNPFVRIIAFKLLIKVNRSLLNEGLYSLIDDHWDSIESDVRNYIFNNEYLKTQKKGKLHEEMFDLETCLRSRYQVPWLYFLAEFSRLILTTNQECMNAFWRKIANYANKLRKRGGLKESNISKSFHQGLFVVFASTAFNINRIKQPRFSAFLSDISDKEKQRYYDDVLWILNNYSSTESHNIFYVFRHLNYTIIPDLLNIIIKIGNSSSNTSDGKSNQVIRTLYSMIRSLDETESFTDEKESLKVFIEVKDLLIKINQDLIKMTNDWEKDIKDYVIKKDREKQKIQQQYKGNMKLYKIILRSFLLIIQILLSKESINSFYQFFGNNIYLIVDLIVLLLEKSTNHKVFKYIKKLSSDILIDILNKNSLPSDYLAKFKNENDYLYFLDTISKCELYKKKVLKVLLKENPSFLIYYVLAYFRARVEIYPLYFSAIYEIIVKNQESIDINNEMYSKVLNLEQNKLWGYLFLLALFRMKTGGKRAEEFLKRLNLIYQKVVWSPKNNIDKFLKDCDDKPEIVPIDYYGKRIAESVVIAGQKELKLDNYSRSLKVMVDVLVPFVKQFQFYPNYNTCIPSQSEKKGDRLPKKEFLDNLMEITFIKTKVVNGFDKVLKLWMTLLKRRSHRDLVFWYIFNYEKPENPDYIHNKVILLNALMTKYPYNVIYRLYQRCRFSFYAFCNYQRIKDYENEFWIVDILIDAIDMIFNPENEQLYNDLYNFLPIFIHYALLFHANQTTKLLIKLCSKFEIPYSKMALSSDTLQRIVNSFQKRSLDENLKETWKREAMRWVVGCNKLKYAHTSLIILNALEKGTFVEFESPTRQTASSGILSITSSTSNNNLNSSSTSVVKDIKPFDIRSKSKDKLNELVPNQRRSQTQITINSTNTNDSTNTNTNNSSNTKNKNENSSDDVINSDNNTKSKNENSSGENNNNGDDDNYEEGNNIDKSKSAYNDSMRDIEEKEDENENNNDDQEENLAVDLLKGVMKSTAHFIEKDFYKDRNEVYEFIDDTFQLFNRYFNKNKRTPILCLNYLDAFLDNDIPIDAYFPEMNALFESCFNSKITGQEARKILPNFFRPLLHVLESDSDAKKSFDRLVTDISKKGQSVIDIELVQAVLNRNETRIVKNDEDIILGAELEDLNRVLGHYASMIDNSSPDLKKRIFLLSTLIIERFKIFKESKKSKKAENSIQQTSTSTLTTNKTNNTTTADVTKSQQSSAHNHSSSNNNNSNITKANRSRKGSQIKIEIDSNQNQPKSPIAKSITQIMSSEFNNTDNNELNSQYAVQIFNAAVKSLPDNKEAMKYILKANEFNPLFSTITFDDFYNINISIQNTKTALYNSSKQDNDVVTLTDCKKIASASNLIDAQYLPSILPFTSEMSLLYNPDKSFKALFDKWGLILKCIAGQILKKSIEKKDDEVKFTKLTPPMNLITDDKMKKYEQDPLLPVDQFLQL